MFVVAILLFALVRPIPVGSMAGSADPNSSAGQGSYELLRDLTRQAQQDFQQGQFHEAREKLRKALAIAPRDPALWKYLGLTDEQLNDFDAAINDFKKVLSILPGDAQARFDLGRLYGRKGQNAIALEMYGQGLKIAPKDLPANQNYALLLMADGKFREAVIPLQRMRALNGSDLSTRATLIECYLKAAMTDEGRREIQDFLAVSNATPKEKFKLGKLLVDDKFPDLAQPILQQVVAESPASADAHALLGQLLLNASQYENAITQLRLAVQLAPESSENAMHLAEALLLAKQYPEALDFLVSVHPRFGDQLEYRFKMALALYGSQQYPQAISLLEELDRQEPNLDLIQYYLGNVYNETGDLEKAQASCKKAIALNPNQSSYYVLLAKVLGKEGDDKTDEAIANLQKALALEPSDDASKEELALAYERKHEYSAAESLLQQVVLHNPDMMSAHVALGRIYYQDHKKDLGDAEKSIVKRLETQ